MIVFKIALLSLVLASLGYYAACILAAGKFFSRPSSGELPAAVPGGNERPPVTVLIPLCGVDFEAYENYASFCRQHYPTYQLLFGVQDPSDSSIPVIRRLEKDFPLHDIELVVGDEVVGENRKVNNLHNMLKRAKHEILVIADSDVRVGPDFLQSLVPELSDGSVGLTSCLYKAGKAPGFAAALEAIGISAEFIPGVLVAWMKEEMTFALGAVMVTSKSKLQSIHGLKSVADYLADDYMLGNLMWRAGYRVLLSRYIVETMPAPVELRSMLRHQIRWSRTIRASRPWGHLGMIVTHGTVWALLNAFLHGGAPLGMLLFLVTLIMRFTVAWTVGVRYLGDSILRRNLWKLPARDLMSFYVWLMGLMGRKVEWRGRIYEIGRDGKMCPVKET